MVKGTSPMPLNASGPMWARRSKPVPLNVNEPFQDAGQRVPGRVEQESRAWFVAVRTV